MRTTRRLPAPETSGLALLDSGGDVTLPRVRGRTQKRCFCVPLYKFGGKSTTLERELRVFTKECRLPRWSGKQTLLTKEISDVVTAACQQISRRSYSDRGIHSFQRTSR